MSCYNSSVEHDASKAIINFKTQCVFTAEPAAAHPLSQQSDTGALPDSDFGVDEEATQCKLQGYISHCRKDHGHSAALYSHKYTLGPRLPNIQPLRVISFATTTSRS